MSLSKPYNWNTYCNRTEKKENSYQNIASNNSSTNRYLSGVGKAIVGSNCFAKKMPRGSSTPVKNFARSTEGTVQMSCDIISYHLVAASKPSYPLSDIFKSTFGEDKCTIERKKSKGNVTERASRREKCRPIIEEVSNPAKAKRNVPLAGKHEITSKTTLIKKPEEPMSKIKTTTNIAFPTVNIKICNAKNKALENFLLQISPVTKRCKITYSEEHNEKQVGDPHFLKNYFEDLIKQSKEKFAFEEFPYSTYQTEFNTEKSLGTNSNSTNYLPPPQCVQHKESLMKILDTYSLASVCLPLKSVIELHAERKLRKKRYLSRMFREKEDLEKKKKNMSVQRPNKSMNSALTENKKEVSGEFKRKILEQLLNATNLSPEQKEQHLSTIENLVDVFTENGSTENVVIAPKEQQNDKSTASMDCRKYTKNREVAGGKKRMRFKRIPFSIKVPLLHVVSQKPMSTGVSPLQIKEMKIERTKQPRYLQESPDKNPPFKAQTANVNKESTPPRLREPSPPKIRRMSSEHVSPKISPPKVEAEVLDKKKAAVSIDELVSAPFNPLATSMRTYKSLKPPTFIKVIHKDYTHLNDHPINKTIHYLNQFIALTFKNKDPNALNKRLIIPLAKALNLQLPTGKNGFNTQTFKNKETAHPMKEKLLKHLFNVINNENEYVPPNDTSQKQTQPKFYVSMGNNGILVKSVLKQRWWWSYGSKNDEGLNLCWTQWCKKPFVQSLASKKHSKESSQTKMCNHMEHHYHLSNKKAMFINMREYYQTMGQDPFDTLPLTFHIKLGITDPEFEKFASYYAGLEAQGEVTLGGKKPAKNVWIIKPGENSNRGYGIQVCKDMEEIKKIVTAPSKAPRTHIVQKYIENPLLIGKRKFDIRMYGLITSVNGLIKGYFYEEGYIRTSSKEYTLKNLANKTIHLTNDAVQQKTEDYGKYEPGNKLSFSDFQKYLDSNYGSLNIDFNRDLLPQIKKIITDTFRAVYPIIDPNRRLHTFEIFGYDFMIDKGFKIYLIEANTNPCLEVSSPLLGRLIPLMVDNALKLALDPVFPLVDLQSTGKRFPTCDILNENKFQLVFDEKTDAATLAEYVSKRQFSHAIDEIEEEEEGNSSEEEQGELK